MNRLTSVIITVLAVVALIPVIAIASEAILVHEFTGTIEVREPIEPIERACDVTISPGETKLEAFFIKNIGDVALPILVTLDIGDLYGLESEVLLPEFDISPGDTEKITVKFVAKTSIDDVTINCRVKVFRR